MKLITFLICDDIRQEIGNKHSIMGLYDDTLEFIVSSEKKNQWPKSIRLGIFAKFNLDKNDKASKNFKILLNNNKEEVEIGHGVLALEQLLNKNKITIALLNNFTFKESGIVTFKFNFYDENNKLISSIIPDNKIKVFEKSSSS